MELFIALLRGVNVNGKNKLNMQVLRQSLEQAGYNEVQTYIQSGNILFKSAEINVDYLQKALQKLIFSQFKFSVPVIVLTNEQLSKILIENPFLSDLSVNVKGLYYCLLQQYPQNSSQCLKNIPESKDNFIITGKTVYLLVQNGYGNTKLNNNFFEKKLNVTATTRNHQTLQKLLEMSQNFR
ncbi:MAG: DUF1697 domain-containing protein [Bacteroidetes bacterium]|nr:DUF1697 domain-containing protein [Bacteroidota bacterium]MBS1739120.1 DUF1697 domain-containing protein [Bacteroidota bacterium]